MNIKRILNVLIIVFVLCFSTSAFALDMEFYTYGGFMPIVQSFTRIALIFSDAGFHGLIFVITVMGFLAAGLGWVIKGFTGARIVPLVWAVPVMFGAVIYLALFVPKGNITVYDPVLNRFQTVGNIPNAVVFTAGFLNKIERGMVDIIDTAGTPATSYKKTAGGIGFKALKSIKGSSPKDNYARTSMIRYVRDCVTFELNRPGTTLSLDDLRNNTTDFLTDLSKAVNPAVYTVYYDGTNPSGTSMTCTAAWNNLQAIYANPNNYSEAIKKTCSKSFFDPTSATELATCKNLIQDTLNLALPGGGVTPEKLIQQQTIASILYRMYFQDDADANMVNESNRKITSSGMGIGLTMNEWIPIIRAVLTAIAIGVIPFLVIFIPTPVVGKAASVMFGFFVFLTTWGITDAVIHSAAMDYAVYAFEEARQSNLGVYAMVAFPSISTKLLAMFGVIRSSGLMLASFFTMMLIKFGGHALAMLAGNLTGIAQSAGAQSGRLLSPEGTSAAMNEQVRAAGLLSGMPEHSFTNLANAGAYQIHRQVGGYNAAINARNTLQSRGEIPQGLSDGQLAQMIASAGVSLGTAKGVSKVSMAPNGHATMVQSSGVNPDGSSFSETSGVGGGVATDTLAAGKAIYSVGSNGVRTLTSASVNGLDPLKVGSSAIHQKIASASHSMGSSTNWNTAYSQIQRDAQTSSEARTFSNRLDNAIRSGWSRSFSDKSSFIHSMDEKTRNIFQGAISGGFKSIVSANAGGTISVIGEDGEKVSFNVDENTARQFTSDQARVRSEAMQQTMSDSQGLDYMRNVAKQIGANEAYSFLNDAKEMRSSTESYGADLTTAIVVDYATNRYGSATPENIRRTITDFNHYLTQQGSQGVKNMHDIINGFVSGKGYGWGSTTHNVHSAMNATRSRLHESNSLKNKVNTTADYADSQTSGINSGSFSAPAGSTMQEPNRSVVDKADHIRRANRREESGQGNVRTSIKGMAGEAVGKVAPGLVDSQGMRPTDQGFMDNVNSSTVVDMTDGKNQVGPVPKNRLNETSKLWSAEDKLEGIDLKTGEKK